MDALLTTISAEAAKHGFKAISDWLNREHTPKLLARHDIEDALTNHLRYAKNWCRHFLIDEMANSRVLSDTFVEPALTSGKSLDHGTRTTKQSYRSFLIPGTNRVVFGYPGAGKTTLVMRLCYHLLHEAPDPGAAYDFPMIIRLRELTSFASLVDYILHILQVQIDEDWSLPDKYKHITDKQKGNAKPPSTLREAPDLLTSIKESIVYAFFNSRSVLLLLDGFDELPLAHRATYRREIELFSHHVDSTDVLLTSRSAINVGTINRVEQYFICPFTEADVRTYAEHWFDDKHESGAFIAALSETPYHGSAVRPLTLATLCALYERYGEIPSPPREVYRRIVNMYLEKWDQLRDIRRMSEYGKFGPDRKREFLAALAYEIAKSSNSIQFSNDELRNIYATIHERFHLPSDQATRVLEEIESHNGLVVLAGFDKFEFYHKSVFEYLCADVLSRLPLIPENSRHLLRMPDSSAIATSLSADPNGFLSMLVFRDFKRSHQRHTNDEAVPIPLDSFWTPYLERCRVEGVRFTVDELLGVCFLTLCSFGWKPVRGIENQFIQVREYESFFATLIEFANLSEVGKSIRLLKADIIEAEATREWFRLRTIGRKRYNFFGSVPAEFVVDERLRDFWQNGVFPRRIER